MPGNRYAQVLNTYLTRRLLMAASLGTIALSLMPITIWWMVGRHGSADPTQAMFPLFLGFPAMFLGAHLKQQLATHEASLVPGYRTPHLIIAALLFLVPILCAIVVAPVVGGSVPGHAAVFLMICLVMFQASADSNGLAGLLVLLVYLPMLVPQLRIAMAQVLAGQMPGLTSCLLSAEVAGGVLLFHRLANLTEDDPSYGNVMPMNVWDMRAAEVRRRNRAQLQKSPRMILSLIEPESKRLDQLTAIPATTRRQRVALLAMGGDWPVHLPSTLFMVLLLESVPLLLPYLSPHVSAIRTESQFANALSWPIMLSMMTAWIHWLPQSQRLSRLGYESLRPSTRQDWVLENGLAIILNSLKMLAGWLVIQIILLCMFLSPFATSPAILNGLVFLAGVHVLLFGAAAGIASFGSMFWKFVGFMMLIGIVQGSWPAVSSYSLTCSWPIPVFACICGAVGVMLTRIAYRRWCRIDLM